MVTFWGPGSFAGLIIGIIVIAIFTFVALKIAKKDGAKVTAIALFYAPEHGEFYDRKIKLSKADAQAKGVQAGAFVPALMKYDKEMHYFVYKKLV